MTFPLDIHYSGVELLLGVTCIFLLLTTEIIIDQDLGARPFSGEVDCPPCTPVKKIKKKLPVTIGPADNFCYIIVNTICI